MHPACVAADSPPALTEGQAGMFQCPYCPPTAGIYGESTIRMPRSYLAICLVGARLQRPVEGELDCQARRYPASCLKLSAMCVYYWGPGRGPCVPTEAGPGTTGVPGGSRGSRGHGRVGR